MHWAWSYSEQSGDSNLHRPGLSWRGMGRGGRADNPGKTTLLPLLVTGLSDAAGRKMSTKSNQHTAVSGLDALPAQDAPQ